MTSSSNPPPPIRTILIGKSRRITIDELISLCISKNGKLEMFQTNDTNEKEESTFTLTLDGSQLKSKEDSNDNLLSEASSRAVICLLAMTISQGRVLEKHEESWALSQALIHLFYQNHDQNWKLRLLAHPIPLAQAFQESLDPMTPTLTYFFQKTLVSILPRILSVSTASLFSGMAQQLVTASDGMAALSAERLRIDPTLCFQDVYFDTLRPHRGCITTANTLRAILQGSTFAKASSFSHKKKKSIIEGILSSRYSSGTNNTSIQWSCT